MARTDLFDGKNKSSHVWIDVTIRADREKSLLVDTPKGEAWLPKSTIGARKKDDDGNIIRLEVKRQMAEKKGIL